MGPCWSHFGIWELLYDTDTRVVTIKLRAQGPNALTQGHLFPDQLLSGILISCEDESSRPLCHPQGSF
jgi:hypothetical protein